MDPTTERLLAANDRLLEPLILAGPGSADAQIERLIVGVVNPLIARILLRYVHSRRALPQHDADDIASMVNLRLLDKLRRLPADEDEGIRDLEKYVATLAYNAINDHIRRRFPERARLKNRLRYVLTHDARLALWNARGSLMGGLKEWEPRGDGKRKEELERLRLTRVILDQAHPGDAIHALFEAAGGPVELEILIDFAASIWNVPESPAGDLSELRSEVGSISARMERREFLGRLWTEIRVLRPMQRRALLLNLREGTTVNVASLLVLTGVAPFDDIADVLEMSGEELSGIWNDLPLDDLEIAAMMGITRQQVINLRKAARARLVRRVFSGTAILPANQRQSR